MNSFVTFGVGLVLNINKNKKGRGGLKWGQKQGKKNATILKVGERKLSGSNNSCARTGNMFPEHFCLDCRLDSVQVFGCLCLWHNTICSLIGILF